MEEVRIIIAGSRTFNDYKLLKESIYNIFKDKHIKRNDVRIISGTANGADKLGERYAQEFGLKLTKMSARWNEYGKSAGYVRNAEMAKYAVEDDNIGVLVAFWDGVSKGTKHMIDLANRYGLEVHIIKF
jgi:hypothetical protein